MMNTTSKRPNFPGNLNSKLQKLKAIKSKVTNLDKIYQDFGRIAFLFGSSKYYQQFSAQHLIIHAFLPLKLGQYKIYYRGLKPYAFVSWAFLSDEIQEKFQTGDYLLQEDEFNCGKNIWLTEFVTPEDDARGDHQDRNAIIRDLKEKFNGKKGSAILRNMDGTVKRITSI